MKWGNICITEDSTNFLLTEGFGAPAPLLVIVQFSIILVFVMLTYVPSDCSLFLTFIISFEYILYSSIIIALFIFADIF